jgi:ABC-type transporter Mla subunit MlaD
VTWMLVATLIAVCAAGLYYGITRARRAIPRALDTLDGFGRDLQPALVRLRTATDDVRARTPQG